MGISVKDSHEDAKKFVANMGFTFPNGRDPDFKISRAFLVDSAPTTFFIAPTGEILGRANVEMNEKELMDPPA